MRQRRRGTWGTVLRGSVRTVLCLLVIAVGAGARAQPALLQQVMNMSPAEREALMRQYGISPQDAAALLQEQGVRLPGGAGEGGEGEGAEGEGAGSGVGGSGLPGPAPESAEQREMRRFLILQQLEDAARSRETGELGPVAYGNRYGLQVFRRETDAAQGLDNVPVPEDYRIGPGDVFLVSLYGTEARAHQLEVRREGWIDFPALGPVNVAGVTFAEARELIRAKIEAEMIGVQAAITLQQLKSIRIAVTGEVERPGIYVVPSLASVIQVLAVAGGPTDVGSLRRIRLVGGESVRTLDLYADLVFGEAGEILALRPGDALHVPAVEGAAEVQGAVRRPAVYEVVAGETLGDLLHMAGGLAPGASAKDVILRRYRADGTQEVSAVDLSRGTEGRATALADGMLVRVPRASDFRERVVQVRGEVTVPGLREWRPGLRVSDLFPDPRRDLRVDRMDLDIGLIVRRDPDRRTLTFHPFAPGALLDPSRSAEDPLLEAQDHVLVLPMPGLVAAEQARAEERRAEREALIASLTELASASEPIEAPLVERAMQVLRTEEDGPEPETRQELLAPYLDRLSAQPRDGSYPPLVELRGEVRVPGLYPLLDGGGLAAMIALAGGVNERAELASAVLLRAETESEGMRIVQVDVGEALAGLGEVTLAAGDVLTVRRDSRIADRLSVRIDGEVASPGSYTLPAGSTLADALLLAGGVTERADLRAAVFSRARLRSLEGSLRERYLADLREGLINASVAGDTRTAAPSTIELIDDLEAALEAEPVGRLQIDLPRLALGDESADVALQDGDRLTIPPFVNAVTVAGQVRMPGSFALVEGMSVESYLEMAGGASEYADEDAIFVVRANGSVEGVGRSGFLSFGRRRVSLEPGDRIVVPLKYDYIRGFDLTRDIVQIVYQSGIGLAAVVGLFRN